MLNQPIKATITEFLYWDETIKSHILGECWRCLATIADDLRFGRKPNPNDSTLCDCCDVR